MHCTYDTIAEWKWVYCKSSEPMMSGVQHGRSTSLLKDDCKKT